MSLTVTAVAAEASSQTPKSPTFKHEPRRSNRVGDAVDVAQADGDTWQEKIAVCEGATPQGHPRLLLRSYFRNNRTKQRVWDEPPSGASNIRFATAKDRKTAEQQMQELQITLDMIPPESPSDKKTPKKDDSKKGFFGRFRRKDKQQQQQVNESQDLNLQRAIARSMMDQGGIDASPDGGGDSPVILFDPDQPSFQPSKFEDDEVALAKALSMSESAHPSMSEEEMLLMAIEESKIEAERSQAAAGVAALPSNDVAEFEVLLAFNDTRNDLPDKMDQGMDRKMPALKHSPPTAAAADAFDPFNMGHHGVMPSNIERVGDSQCSTGSSSTGKGKFFSRGGRKPTALENDAGLV